MTGSTGRPPVTGGLGQAGPRDPAGVLAEREAIQANLLELDGSFVKRMLEGATLTGQTRQRWAAASASLAALWETYLAYSAVVDRIAAIGGNGRRPSKREQAELTELLAGGCVQLPDAPGGPARRDLASRGRPPVTLATAVAAMRRSFAEVTDVTSAVEAVWAAVGPPLDAAEADLATSRPLAAGLGAETELAFNDVETAVDAVRSASTTDPLAFLQGDGRVDTTAVDRLPEQTAALRAKITELDRLRSRARTRIDALAAAAGAARADRRDALAAVTEAAARVTLALPAPLSAGGADVAEPRLAGLSALAAGGHWDRLRAELDRGEAELAAAADQTAEIRRLAAAALARRDELRGLLGAYKAKAARLGASEDVAISGRYEQARDLLWSAPCDLAAAEAAVSGYQQAILATERRR